MTSSTRDNNGSDPKYLIPNLARGMRLLELLAGYPDGLAQSVIAQMLSIPPNSVFRIVVTLENLGYLSRDPESRQVVLTRKMLGISHSAVRETSLVEKSLPPMRQLRDQTGETVVLNVRYGHESVVLERVEGTHPFRFAVDPGLRSEITCAAHGKAILANLSQSTRESVLDKSPFTRWTDATIVDRSVLERELDVIRRTGYAIDREEGQKGVRCVSAAIFDHTAKVAGAITVTGPAERLSDEVQLELGPAVRKAAAEISVQMGNFSHAGPPKPHIRPKKHLLENFPLK
jgi:DNA-binding IclR family transcriptional regulator